MSSIRYVTPLQLPPNWEKTPPGRRSYDNNFSRALTINEALDCLEDELNLLAADTAITVHTSYESIRNDRIRQALNNDTGVSVSIGSGRSTVMIACDKWALFEHNIYALSLGLRAMRNMESWGICPSGRLLSACTTHPPSSLTSSSVDSPVQEWMKPLGLGPTATLEDANAVYRRRAKDIANDQQALTELNLAMEAARRHLR